MTAWAEARTDVRLLTRPWRAALPR